MSKAQVLIVEDSFIVSFHLQKTLEREGYSVVGTEPSGESALQLLEHKHPDVVLMDIMLAGTMDGIETARSIRSRFHIPVIFITALTDKETIERAKITEPYGYLTKPFEDREVFTVIEMALYKHRIETKLRESEERFFSTVRSISDGVLVIDNQFRIKYLNPSAERLTGLKMREGETLNFFEVLRFRDPEAIELEVNPFHTMLVSSTLNALPDHSLLLARDGTFKPVESTLSPMTDSQGDHIGLVMICRDISDKIAHQRLLKELEKAHISALIEGQEKERRRIAKDLHDGLGQILNAIKLKINLVVGESEKAEALYSLLDEAIQESVRISENLVPSKLKDFDLDTCIRSLCNDIQGATGFPVSFESFGNFRALDINQKTNLYRISQEAISNAIRHARASAITVQLTEREDGFVQLTIEDDGRGFHKEASYDKSVHHGLVNMKERAEILGGTLTLESDANRGTLVIIESPVKKTA